MAPSRLARTWAAWAEPWREWRARLFRWIAATGAKRCPQCGHVADDRGDLSLGPPLCPRCGTRFEVPGE